MIEKIRKIEVAILLVLFIYFLFVAVNVNQTLGIIYSLFSLGSAVFILADSKRTIPFRKENDNFLSPIAIGAAAYLGLVLLGQYIIIPGVQKIIDLLAASTPALSTSVFFNNLSFGVAVPIAETYLFFIVGYDLLASVINVDIDKRNLASLKLWTLIIGISAAFMFFHITAKGITNAPILALVFFMGIISLMLVTWFKKGEQATYFHIISNAVPIFFAKGLI